MRKALLILFFAGISVWATAQLSISINPESSSGSGLASSPDIAAYCHITNNSSVPVSLLWTRSVVSKPTQWLSWVCDNTTCYLPFVDTCPEDRTNNLDPGQSFNLSYHVNPLNVDGEGEFMLYVYDLSDPNIILDSVQFLIETSTTSVSDPAHSSLKIYPNPTTSYFQVENSTDVAKVVVYNIVGSKMKEFDARNQTRFDVADLTEGIYLIRLLDARQNVLKTVRLSKK